VIELDSNPQFVLNPRIDLKKKQKQFRVTQSREEIQTEEIS
jgi:hypothetical protein